MVSDGKKRNAFSPSGDSGNMIDSHGKSGRKERQDLRPSGLKWLSIFNFILDNRGLRLLKLNRFPSETGDHILRALCGILLCIQFTLSNTSDPCTSSPNYRCFKTNKIGLASFLLLKSRRWNSHVENSPRLEGEAGSLYPRSSIKTERILSGP